MENFISLKVDTWLSLCSLLYLSIYCISTVSIDCIYLPTVALFIYLLYRHCVYISFYCVYLYIYCNYLLYWSIYLVIYNITASVSIINWSLHLLYLSTYIYCIYCAIDPSYPNGIYWTFNQSTESIYIYLSFNGYVFIHCICGSINPSTVSLPRSSSDSNDPAQN